MGKFHGSYANFPTGPFFPITRQDSDGPSATVPPSPSLSCDSYCNVGFNESVLQFTGLIPASSMAQMIEVTQRCAKHIGKGTDPSTGTYSKKQPKEKSKPLLKCTSLQHGFSIPNILVPSKPVEWTKRCGSLFWPRIPNFQASLLKGPLTSANLKILSV